jgi:hypothetical protein
MTFNPAIAQLCTIALKCRTHAQLESIAKAVKLSPKMIDHC